MACHELAEWYSATFGRTRAEIGESAAILPFARPGDRCALADSDLRSDAAAYRGTWASCPCHMGRPQPTTAVVGGLTAGGVTPSCPSRPGLFNEGEVPPDAG